MNYVRWFVRGLMLLSVGFILFFVIGEGLNPTGVWPTLAEWVGLFFFPFGLAVGLIIGWWRERLGGIIAVGSLLAFYLWGLIVSGNFPRGPYFLLLALPGFLLLLLGWRMPKQS